jgi:hypothetical protein
MKRFMRAILCAVLLTAVFGVNALAQLPVTNGLECWYDASVGIVEDGSGVLTWEDQSGQEHHATRAAGTVSLVSNELNSLPAVHLRTAAFMNCAGAMFTKEQYLVVRSPHVAWSGGGSFLGRRSDDFLSVRASSYNMNAGTTGFWSDQYPQAVSRNGAVVPLNPPAPGFALAPITAYMLLKITVNDAASAQNRIAYPFYQIGKNETVGTMDFDVAEIIGYDTALSPVDEAAVGSYLADKYEMTTTYPLLNPPAAPTSLSAVGQWHAVRLDWVASWRATNYFVYRGTVMGVYEPTPIASTGEATTYTDTHDPGEDGQTFYYVVSAVNALGEGDASAEASAAPSSNKTDQVITFTALAVKTYGDAPFALGATADSGLPVSYVSSDPNVASLSGSTVTLLKAGSTTMTASQSGNAGFNPAIPVDQVLTVDKAQQTITFSQGLSLVKSLGVAPFDDSATGGASGNPVTYSSTNEAVATVQSNGLVTVVGVGDTAILANQLGDAGYYSAAPEVSQALTIIPVLPLPVTEGVVCWYDASVGVVEDGSGVLVWEDQSGLGHHATRAAGTVSLVSNELNSLPAMQLRNAAFMNCAGAMFTKEQYLVVRSPHANWSGGGSFLGRRSGDFLSVRASSYNMHGGTTGFWHDHYPQAVTRNGTALPLNAPAPGFVLTPITEYMLLKITVDDTASAQNRIDYPLYQIGKNETVGTMDFDVAEIIGYDDALSPTDEAALGAFLAEKYRILTAYPPSAPTGLVVAGSDGARVRLEWTELFGATGYTVWSSNSTTHVVSTNASVTHAFTLTGLDNALYYFKVAGMNSGGQGLYSAMVSARPTWRGVFLLLR